MERIKNQIFPLSTMLTLPLLSLLYPLLNNSKGDVHSLLTNLDQGIPFWKGFILPYISLYPFLTVTLLYFYFKDRKIYYTTVIAANISMLISYEIYYLFQTTVPRPELIGKDLLTQMVAFVYAADNPYNAFPSIHVLTSYLMIKAINKSHCKNHINTFIIYSFAILIMASTQFIKQHSLADAVAALLLGELIYESVCFFAKKDILPWFVRGYRHLSQYISDLIPFGQKTSGLSEPRE